MPYLWEVRLSDFIGNHEVIEETEELDDTFSHEIEWLTMSWLPNSLRPVPGSSDIYIADVAEEDKDVALVQNNGGNFEVVGGYCNSVLWVNKAFRGKGYALELIIAAADKRNCDMDPVSYTQSGLNSHKAAHRFAVERALQKKHKVPDYVLMDYPDLRDADMEYDEGDQEADEPSLA